MGAQQSTNGSDDAYKVDIFGEDIRKKFDRGELKVTPTHLCFMGAKNSFEWPLQDFKRFGQAKRVFSVELLDFNDVLNTREIIFRSKRAQVICDDFRGKLAALEQHVQPESPPMIEAVS
ncbi:uncharacterized protein LOC117291873 [Asterias rubens]|uniref:uncharacterized protein LOC117291873 n=1 Tax=Asterias rubens TaxID=7604 RepID=UPI001455223F|nr:uncharacterized protein LOC117291873 [Asterias rubens]XP_033629707.1 uncharacterized protein LOC117291873 [Asterias rubens]XP_033629709.1 uncharacterized protein LOC117291873 [Asterias rubens]